MRVELRDEAREDFVDGVWVYERQYAGLSDYFVGCVATDLATLESKFGFHELAFGFHRISFYFWELLIRSGTDRDRLKRLVKGSPTLPYGPTARVSTGLIV